ncbi:efflux RND transporter periplasmic adaptor subunit [Paraglaciecola aquimarina]|uniref:Efflux RND transporter periplasmic adaptor subunit n=1 Tax=Paraglaciecola aquimarina TaxID=1235557 RepID=A0ABU3SUQ9_9ALTE|nr:efflux RND transporter periplasmic adaptor subunit [Paraglaciecola aquimarina]MDU0353743.1 efflux RND transporter periplasmic adaptor subunit [Paraglaciecola aquimarina]
MLNLQRLFYLCVVTCLCSSQLNAKSTDVRVVTQALKSTALVTELVLSGTVRPLHSAELSVATEALVSALHVEVGSKVKQGDLLLELDAELAKQLHIGALAQVSAAEVTLKEAQRVLDEGLRLLQQKHVTQSEISLRQSNVTIAKAQLEQTTSAARIAKKQLDYHRLYAPFDGVISARWTDLGQWLSVGDQAFTLVSLDNLRLDVRLPQEQLANIDHLQSVTIQPDSHPKLSIAASIDTLVPVGDASRSFLLRLSSNQKTSALLPGTSANGLFKFAHSKVAVVLPRDALLRNADGNYTVFIVEDGIAKRRKVTLGPAGQDGYLVEEGLQPGEQVVIRGNELLSEGSPVIITNRSGLAP